MKLLVCLALMLALGLSGCGKRPRSLEPPPGDPVVQYPRHYPPHDSPDEHL